jgi:hypothetical protein
MPWPTGQTPNLRTSDIPRVNGRWSGPPKADRECAVCGTRFSPRTDTQSLCGTSCRGRWLNSLKAPQVPLPLPCVRCGDTVLTKLRSRHNVLCSACGGQRSITCAYCGTEFIGSGEQRFCSHKCGGHVNKPARGKMGINAARRAVQARDGRKCLDCGTTEGRFIDIHHLIRREDWVGPGSPDDPANLVTLCRRCHATRHAATGLHSKIWQLGLAAYRAQRDQENGTP